MHGECCCVCMWPVIPTQQYAKHLTLAGLHIGCYIAYAAMPNTLLHCHFWLATATPHAFNVWQMFWCAFVLPFACAGMAWHGATAIVAAFQMFCTLQLVVLPHDSLGLCWLCLLITALVAGLCCGGGWSHKSSWCTATSGCSACKVLVYVFLEMLCLEDGGSLLC